MTKHSRTHTARRRGIAFTAAAILGVSLVTAGVASAAPGDVVHIPDAALAGCVSEVLGHGAPFTQGQLATISNLTCSGVADLSGVQFMTGASTLRFEGGTVGDLRPLAALQSRAVRVTVTGQELAFPAVAWGGTGDVYVTHPDGSRRDPFELTTPGTQTGTLVTWANVGLNSGTFAGGGGNSDGFSYGYDGVFTQEQLAGTPQPVTGVFAIGGAQRADLAWDVPESRGNGDVTSYSVRYRALDGAWSTVTTTARELQLTELSWFTEHEVEIGYTTTTGVTGPVFSASLRTEAGTPQPVAAPTVGISGRDSTVTWDGPDTRGHYGHSFRVEWRAPGDGSWTAVAAQAGAMAVSILELPVGDIEFRVVYTAAGGDVIGEVQVATIAPAVVPSAALPSVLG